MENQLVISNTTPIINLAEIEHLDLLNSLFGRVVIPPAVEKEILEKENLFPKAAEAVRKSSFEVIEVKDSLVARAYAGVLHPGEAECLAIAMQNVGSLLIVDELAARRIAKINECFFVGTLGCLIEAKKAGLISEVKPLIESLKIRARFWISDALTARVLEEVGEI